MLYMRQTRMHIYFKLVNITQNIKILHNDKIVASFQSINIYITKSSQFFYALIIQNS